MRIEYREDGILWIYVKRQTFEKLVKEMDALTSEIDENVTWMWEYSEDRDVLELWVYSEGKGEKVIVIKPLKEKRKRK